MARAVKLLFAGQILLAVCLLVCTALLPQFFFSRDQGGLSNYGVHGETVIPFSIGFIGCALLMLAGALTLPPSLSHRLSMRRVLWLVALLLLLVAATTYTYKLNSFFNMLHVRSSQLLTLVEIPLVSWLAFGVVKDRIVRWLFYLFTAGFTIGILTLIGAVRLLNLAELLTLFSSSCLLTYSLHKLTD